MGGSGDVAIAVRIAPSTGPAQGVQISPSVVKTKNTQSVRVAAVPCIAMPASAVLAVTRSNAVGQIINAPKTRRSASSALRSASGSKSSAAATSFNASATKANDTTKPAAIKPAGRRLAGRSTHRAGSGAPVAYRALRLSAFRRTVRVRDRSLASWTTASAPIRGRARRGIPLLLHFVFFHAVLRH